MALEAQARPPHRFGVAWHQSSGLVRIDDEDITGPPRIDSSEFAVARIEPELGEDVDMINVHLVDPRADGVLA